MNKDTIFEELKNSLLNETRLLKRFYDFCISYRDFEFDEMGINTDEAENEQRKALKIKDKLLNEINSTLTFKVQEETTEVLENKIKLIIEHNINESKKTVKFVLLVDEDSFTLEIENIE